LWNNFKKTKKLERTPVFRNAIHQHNWHAAQLQQIANNRISAKETQINLKRKRVHNCDNEPVSNRLKPASIPAHLCSDGSAFVPDDDCELIVLDTPAAACHETPAAKVQKRLCTTGRNTAFISNDQAEAEAKANVAAEAKVKADDEAKVKAKVPAPASVVSATNDSNFGYNGDEYMFASDVTAAPDYRSTSTNRGAHVLTVALATAPLSAPVSALVTAFAATTSVPAPAPASFASNLAPAPGQSSSQSLSKRHRVVLPAPFNSQFVRAPASGLTSAPASEKKRRFFPKIETVANIVEVRKRLEMFRSIELFIMSPQSCYGEVVTNPSLLRQYNAFRLAAHVYFVWT
jgi:hypothetical protein